MSATGVVRSTWVRRLGTAVVLALAVGACSSVVRASPPGHVSTSTSTSVATTGSGTPGPPYAVARTTLTLVEPAGSGQPTRRLPTVVRYPADAEGAPLRARAPYPLIVFSQGFAREAESYATLLASWAAAGFVVADPTYPMTAPSDPTGMDEYDLANHPRDLADVIDNLLASSGSGAPLSGVIDGANIGVAGHSDGADVTLALAAGTCCRDTRIHAAEIFSGAEQPGGFGGSYYSTGSAALLVVHGSADSVSPAACSAQLYNAAPPPKYYVDLLGAGHSDPYIGAGPGAAELRRISTDFFSAYLANDRPALARLNVDSVSSPSVTVSTAPTVPWPGGPCPGF